MAPRLLDYSPRDSTICSREEPSNEAFYSELDHCDCGIGAARPAGRQLGPADDPIGYAASADARRRRAADAPGADMQKGSANEHLRQAQSALADIPEASLTGTTKTRVAELKRHLNKLEQAASQKPESGSTAPRTASANWSGDVAAADRILTELLGSASTTGASTPAPTGTSVRRQRPRRRSTSRRAPSFRKCARTSPRSPRR